MFEEPDFEPIVGVDLEQFAAVSRRIGQFDHDHGRVAAWIGISVHRWEAAAEGWCDRIRRNHAVARRFNLLYEEG